MSSSLFGSRPGGPLVPRLTLKDRVWAAVSVAKLRLAGNPSPPVAKLQEASSHFLIAPANSAGQGYTWARAVERARAETAATSMQFVHAGDEYRFPVDQAVLSGFGAYSRRWQRAQFDAVSRFSAVIVESALPPLGGMHDRDPAAQIEALRAAGVAVGLLFHGSDLRDPDLHVQREPLSYFRDDSELTARMRERARRSQQLIEQVKASVFVSTPDLLVEAPAATWLPVVVDVESWGAPGTNAPMSGGEIPVVVHAPSNAHIKGTPLFESVLRKLDAEGLIQYRPVSGVPHAEMRALIRNADIVVDQMRTGSYGVAACEAMAAGRVVIAHVSEEVRAKTSALSGMALPVVEADPVTLEEVLRGLVRDPEKAVRLSEQGAAFVKHWHDGRESGRVLAGWLDDETLGSETAGKSGE